jgi:2-polyprenyl-3-methyl-5-hydroxy-6-metoxy-1,4-benzoquinol methylase
MAPEKYYDPKLQRAINLAEDGCDISDWPTCHGQSLFARHAKGFLVFLPPSELTRSDEYAAEDPYTVEERIDSGFHRRRIDCTLELLREAVKGTRHGAGLRILDLGCGQGHITERMRQEFADAEFSGLDYSVSAIDYATGHFPGIDFIVANAFECPYANGYFDVVVCNNLWEHVPDPLVLLKCIKRILRLGGFLIVSTPSRYRLRNLVRVLLGKPAMLMSHQHVTEYTVGQLIEQLTYGGFRLLRCYSKPIPVYGWKVKLAKKLASWVLAATGSHHSLEATVFYLAQQTDNPPPRPAESVE